MLLLRIFLVLCLCFGLSSMGWGSDDEDEDHHPEQGGGGQHLQVGHEEENPGGAGGMHHQPPQGRPAEPGWFDCLWCCSGPRVPIMKYVKIARGGCIGICAVQSAASVV